MAKLQESDNRRHLSPLLFNLHSEEVFFKTLENEDGGIQCMKMVKQFALCGRYSTSRRKHVWPSKYVE